MTSKLDELDFKLIEKSHCSLQKRMSFLSFLSNHITKASLNDFNQSTSLGNAADVKRVIYLLEDMGHGILNISVSKFIRILILGDSAFTSVPDLNKQLMPIANKIIGPLARLSEIEIYDRFQTSDMGVYYLVDYKDNQLFWASEKQLNERLSNDEQIRNSAKKDLIELCNYKSKTEGVFLGVYNCNVIASFREIFQSESISYAAVFCLDTFDNLIYSPDNVIYDLGCRLKRLIENNENIINETDRLNSLKKKRTFVDRFHFKKYSKDDKFCVENCDNVATSIVNSSDILEKSKPLSEPNNESENDAAHLVAPRFDGVSFEEYNRLLLRVDAMATQLGLAIENRKQNLESYEYNGLVLLRTQMGLITSGRKILF
ncbi:hypothetical protein BpHYR1_040781 [Brachionus plicatilis]|uniref:Uncharacterized protein n=1 Tax=Brachionus plicatilis TaxID=10195 RepID=A0A3M7Q1J2_BRAPC|nr:hypothetical protein BpHYR1_040781 [Brachionus plicatilis]